MNALRDVHALLIAHIAGSLDHATEEIVRELAAPRIGVRSSGARQVDAAINAALELGLVRPVVTAFGIRLEADEDQVKQHENSIGCGVLAVAT